MNNAVTPTAQAGLDALCRINEPVAIRITRKDRARDVTSEAVLTRAAGRIRRLGKFQFLELPANFNELSCVGQFQSETSPSLLPGLIDLLKLQGSILHLN